MAVKKKFGGSPLGRGLDALISTEAVKPEGSSTINEIEIRLIEANPNQPRREFDQEALQELADSISEIGIIQPITVREMEDGMYQIIAGERRWRASQLAGLDTIPAYVRTASDETLMEMALVENIQRQDLNSIEVALAYQNLIDKYGLTQEKLSERVGKKRATVANFLRLLKLPAPVQVALQNHEIDTGHARALLALSDPKEQVRMFKEVQQKGYSVRQVEDLIKRINESKPVEQPRKPAIFVLPEIENMRKDLQSHLGSEVRMQYSHKGNGKITISFNSREELDRLVALINS